MSRIVRRKRASVFVAALLGAAAALALAQTAPADPLTIVNALRMEGCAGRPASDAPVQRDASLDDVAREMSRNRSLNDAIDRAGYPASSATSFHVKGSKDPQVVRRILTERYCKGISDPNYSELGAFQRGDETWIVLAHRVPPPPVLDPSAVAQRVLELVNGARSEPRRCGRNRYVAAPSVALSATLTEAALRHARDMARHERLDHRGSDGSTSGERITRAGYRWRASGENIAAGQRDADAVVAAWLASPGHCATLMGPHFTEMGVAFALVPSSNPPIYWVQVFAAPQ